MISEIMKTYPLCEHLREDVFLPYAGGPAFKLIMWDTNVRDPDGKHRLAYELYQDEKLLFWGSDFCCSPLHCVDSDESVHGLMSFLCLTTGSVDSEYFDSYNDEQLAFRDQHASWLMHEVMSEFDFY